MNLLQQRSLIEPGNGTISIARQCELLGIHRSGYYYQPNGESALNLEIMGCLDRQYMDTPFYGVLRMHQHILSLGYNINVKRIRRLLRLMGIFAIYPKKGLSLPDKEHKIYPYLLKDVKVIRPNQVWSTDITYIQMAKGFLYLVAIMDWYSRYVISWRLSNTMDSSFCVDALQEALGVARPEMFNTDQGSQFTSRNFTDCLLGSNVKISMDGKGRCFDNIFVERLWRTVKYEYVYINSVQDGRELWHGLNGYFAFYNQKRFHQALGYKRPKDVFCPNC